MSFLAFSSKSVSRLHILLSLRYCPYGPLVWILSGWAEEYSRYKSVSVGFLYRVVINVLFTPNLGVTHFMGELNCRM